MAKAPPLATSKPKGGSSKANNGKSPASKKTKNYHKYAPKSKANSKVAKKAAAAALRTDSLKKGTWEKVKIAGNLITDDGGGLEGLIGLEVLEDYGSAVVATGGKRTYSEEDIDENFALLTKAERKQKRLEYAEKENERKASKQSKVSEGKQKKPAPGSFVRAAATVEDDGDDDGDDGDDVESEDDESAEENDESDDENESENGNASSDDDAEEDNEQLFNGDDVSDIELDDDSDSEQKPPRPEDLTEWHALGVHQLILKALAEKNFRQPTEIQSLTLPAAIRDRKDILGAAETGSGKTLAFGIPILNGILELKAAETSADAGKRKFRPAVAPTVEPTAGSNGSKKRTKQKLGKKGERDNRTPPPEELNFAPLDDDDGSNNAAGKTTAAANGSKKRVKPKLGKKGERDNRTPPPEELNFAPPDADGNDAGGSVADASQQRPLYALVLTPTRELCVQVKDHLVQAAKYTGIQVVAIFGGLAHIKQERVLRKCPEIVVATPGRLWELIRDGNEHLNKLRDINYLVIDETDRMVEKGHFEELKLLIGQLNADPVRKAQRQNFVFSATLTLVHDLPGYIKGKRQKQAQQTAAQKIHSLIEHLGIVQPKVVDITKSTGTAERLTECRIVCELAHKDWYLYYFLQQHPGRTIVFCNSIDCVKRLGQLFTLLECQPRPLHAHMNQRQRLKNLERFTASESGLLIATDVAARGLDIPNVRHVIHYQVPRTGENYVHRSGRTARASNDGISVMMMEPAEVRDYVKLCRTLKRTEDLPLFPCSEKQLKAVKARVDLAREVDVLDLKSRRSAAEVGWLKKSAAEMDIIVDDMSDFSEDDLYDSDDGGERYRGRHELRQKRENLRKLLAQPLFPKGFSYKYPSREGEPQQLESMSRSNAVDVMKSAIEVYREDKKNRNKKRKRTPSPV